MFALSGGTTRFCRERRVAAMHQKQYLEISGKSVLFERRFILISCESIESMKNLSCIQENYCLNSTQIIQNLCAFSNIADVSDDSYFVYWDFPAKANRPDAKQVFDSFNTAHLEG
jgi:hypothetical protein